MAGFTATEMTPVGHNGTNTMWLATSDTTKTLTAAADAARAAYAGVKTGDVFFVSCTDGLLTGTIAANGAIAA